MTDVLAIEGLSVAWGRRGVLHEVDLRIAPGEIVGLVGESGSGKSTLAFSVLRHLPGGRITSGTIRVGQTDVLTLNAAALRRFRQSSCAMIYQDPNAALNPTTRLGVQLRESLRLAGRDDGEATALLRQVGLADPDSIARRFPHEVSGGEKQRVMIAMALAIRPDLLLCDEATTALDATTSAGIVDLLRALRDQTGMAMLFISHDLGTVARLADRITVLRAGLVVESGPARDVLGSPATDYTRRLLAASPDPLAPMPPKRPIGIRLLTVEGLSVRHRMAEMTAVDAVSFTLHEGETLGLVGESGCGKSSLARALVGLVPPQGRWRLDGEARRGSMQLIFQHPDASLNPRHRVGEIVSRPLVNSGLRGRELAMAVGGWLEKVQLPASYAARFPLALSGGEKQRVAIARAFAARPRLVICDEITASLDVSVQADIVTLLDALQRDHGTAMLFISHDLNLVRRVSHRLAVMYLGRLVELRAIADGRLDPPFHPYTEALMSAAPVAAADLVARRVRLRDLPASPGTAAGCRFRARCPRAIGPVCETVQPSQEVGPAHRIACHLPLAELRAVEPIWHRPVRNAQ